MRPEHLGERISALVDGELGHQARDRALAHVAHCASCRAALDAERRIKDALASGATPAPSEDFTRRLRMLAEPGEPVPPRDRRMPFAPIVPTLPTPGRSRRMGRRTAPVDRHDSRRPAEHRSARRSRFAAVGALSAVGLMLGTAFAAGGVPEQGRPVLPPAAELSVEHAATTGGLPLSDPAFDAVTASFGGLSFPPPRATDR